MSSISAGHIVSVVPSVIGAGGAALDFNCLAITKSNRVPIGAVQPFPTAASVTAYFGAGSAEATFAAIYFQGFDGSTRKPSSLLFAQKNGGNVAAYLRGGNVSGLTLAQLQALTGNLTLTVNGTPITSGTINLSAATSFSNAATIIQAGFTTPPFSVTYDAISGGFVFLTTTTGPGATIGYATSTAGGLAGSLLLTQATGAVVSQGAAPANSENAFMNSVVQVTKNWATFATVFDPDQGSGNTSKMNFASWAGGQGNQYIYVAWDQDTSPGTTFPASSSMGVLLNQAGTSGTVCITGTDLSKAAFICGAIASLDFDRKNGRANFAFLSQSGLTPDVTDDKTASLLEQNGYNYYGAFATRNQGFNFFYPGSVTGPYDWLDSLVCEIWMTNSLQVDLMTLLTSVKSIPYNAAGYALIRQACMNTINAALNFGAIRPGVSLSPLEAAEVNNAAGVDIDQVLNTRGWYLQILDASATVRAARGSPPCTLWYMDGGSVNKINLASIMVQ